MLKDGYAAPDLLDMATKLRTAAETAANTGYQKAVNHEDVDPVSLRNSAALFQLAQDVGATDATYAPRARFAEALANLQEHKYAEAEKGFASAMGAGNDKDAKFYAAVSVYRSGDHKRALQQLEKELPDDPRTKLLKVDAAIAQASAEGIPGAGEAALRRAVQVELGQITPDPRRAATRAPWCPAPARSPAESCRPRGWRARAPAPAPAAGWDSST